MQANGHVKNESESDSDDFELLDQNVLVKSTEADQPLTYSQMAAYYLGGFAKGAIVYSSGKILGCFAVAAVAPSAYFMAASYFSPGSSSNALVKTTSSAIISASFDLGKHVGEKVAETTWDLSSSIISRTVAYAYNGGVSQRQAPMSRKKTEKNKHKSRLLKE
jgi:hypothetical protein